MQTIVEMKAESATLTLTPTLALTRCTPRGHVLGIEECRVSSLGAVTLDDRHPSRNEQGAGKGGGGSGRGARLDTRMNAKDRFDWGQNTCGAQLVQLEI